MAEPSELDTFVEVSPAETRIALVSQDGALRRLDVLRPTRPRFHNSIWRTKVTHIEKAMGAAFLNLAEVGEVLLPKARDGKGRPVTEGQWMVVQVSRDQHGGKGAAVQSRLTLVDRYLAFSPFGNGVQFDRGLGKGRLLALATQAVEGADLGEKGGWLVRRPAGAVGPGEIEAARDRLLARWADVQNANDGASVLQLEAAPDLTEKLLRDTPPGGRIATDDRALFTSLKTAAASRAPDLVEGLLFHDRGQALFEETGIDEEIDAALSRHLPLTGGGEVVFDATEAMTVVDVNMGDGSAALTGGDAATRLNMRAATEIGRQIELRNLSGLIVIDLVRMHNRGNAKKVMDALRRGLKEGATSGVTTDVLGLTAGGLLEITRQRSGPSLAEVLLKHPDLEPGPSAETEACDILRQATRLRGGGKPTVRASRPVLRQLTGVLSMARAEVERRLGQELVLVERDTARSEVAMEREGISQ